MRLPNVSIITATYNGGRIINRFLKYIFLQNYPLDKIEIILADGGSRDKTLEIIKEYQKKYPKNIKLIHNKKRYAEGKGMAKDIMTRNAKGEILVILDQDNILVQIDWIKNIVEILTKNKNINAVQSTNIVKKGARPLDSYLNATSVDPFSIFYSLNAQVNINPKKFKYDKEGDFYIYTVNLKNFLFAGGDGFVIRKKDLMDCGGYTQDSDNFYRMALKKYKIAVPRKVKFHHDTSITLKKFLQKKSYYVMHYLLRNNKNRDMNWFDIKKNSFEQNIKFIFLVGMNLLFLPNLIVGLKMTIKEKRLFWLIHPIITNLVTMIYIIIYFYSMIFKKVGIGYV